MEVLFCNSNFFLIFYYLNRDQRKESSQFAILDNKFDSFKKNFFDPKILIGKLFLTLGESQFVALYFWLPKNCELEGITIH